MKVSAKLKYKEKDTLNFEVSMEISEEVIADQISTVNYNNMCYWPSNSVIMLV